jgi:hypothetical protein
MCCVGSAPPPLARRNFLLLTKVLQALANGVYFGTKERHMLPLNPALTTHMPRVRHFCESFANPLWLADQTHPLYPFRSAGAGAGSGAGGSDSGGESEACTLAAGQESLDLLSINHMAKEVKADCALLLNLIKKHDGRTCSPALPPALLS